MSGPGGMAGAVSGESYVRYWEKVLPSESGLALEQATQGMVTTPRLPEFKECLGNAFRHRMGLSGCLVLSHIFDLPILDSKLLPVLACAKSPAQPRARMG